MIKWPEPAAHMWQHEETGRVGFVEASQPLDQWTKANPRLAIVAKVHTEAQLKQAVRDALIEAWRVDWYELMRLGTLVTRDDAATLSDRIEEKLDALIKEIET